MLPCPRNPKKEKVATPQEELIFTPLTRKVRLEKDSVRGFRPVCVLFVQALVLVLGRRELPFDEQIPDVAGQFQGVAVGNNDVGDFALLERAALVSQIKNLRRVTGDGARVFGR